MGLKGTICAFPPQGHLAECRNSPFAPFQWQASKRLLGVLCDGLQKGAQSVLTYDHEKVREERVLLPTPPLCCGGPIPDFPLRDVERRCPASEDQPARTNCSKALSSCGCRMSAMALISPCESCRPSTAPIY